MATSKQWKESNSTSISLMIHSMSAHHEPPPSHSYHEKLKAELELLQKQNIIAPVTEATDWCAPIVVNPTDSIHMCVDLSHLNQYMKRELYQSATPAEAVADISTSKAKFFTILHAMKGYHQCPLDRESQWLITFITPHGRFKYLMEYHQFLNTSTAACRRLLQVYQDIVEL